MIGENKKILITFDYELFLGKDSGHVKRCLIIPTDKILDCLKKNDFKAIFFIDTVYLARLEQIQKNHPAAAQDYFEIKKQITAMIMGGHYIYPHIHPHWLDAVYNEKENTWRLDNFEKYCFASLDVKLQCELFSQSIDVLRSIMMSAGKKTDIDGYRAGGWSIQPFESFRPLFEKYNIKYEFSVVPGKYYESAAQRYDFSNSPIKPWYHFDIDICKEDANGPFTEFTISVLELPKWINYCSDKLNAIFYRLKMPFMKTSGDGKTIHLEKTKSGDKYFSGKNRRMVSLENLTPAIYFYQLKKIKQEDYWHFISHPKMLTPMDFFFANMLMKSIRKMYRVQTDFRQFEQS